MKTLGAISVMNLGFDTCALNMSRNRLQRSSFNYLLEQVTVGSNPAIPTLGGCSIKVMHSFDKTDFENPLLYFRKLMIKAYKFKTLKSYGLRFIDLLINYQIHGVCHPFINFQNERVIK